MKIALVCALFLSVAAAIRFPEFDDELLGKLVVSRRKFPFLTSKDDPDLAHVFPTDQQLALIQRAVDEAGSSEDAEAIMLFRKKRHLRMKRQLGGDGEIDIPDPAAGFDWFEKFQRFLGKFLKFEFSYEILNSTIVDPGSLPFDKIQQDAYFKAFVIDRPMFKPYLEREFNPRMRNLTRAEKPWLPAEKLIQEMKECLYFRYGSASDEDFKYDKNKGGVMVYYKVTCMRIEDMYYVGLSTYDNKFVLHDIEHVETTQSGWSFLGFKKSKQKIRRWFEKRYITLNDLQKLLDYIMRDFAERIRVEYRQYLNSANIPVPEE